MPLRLRNRPSVPATAPGPAEAPAPPAQPEGFFANLRRPENLVRLGGSLLGGAALTAGLAPFIGPAAPFVGFGGAGALSEFGAEKLEQFKHIRKKVNPLQVATQGALNAVPMGEFGVASGIAKGAMLGGGAEMASRYAETGEVAPPSGRALLTGAVIGAGAGAMSRFMRPREVPTSSTPVTEGRAPVSGDANLMRAKVDRARELSAEIGDHVSPWNVPAAESFVRSRALDTIRENARNLRFRQPALPVEGALDIAAGPPPRLRAQLPSNVRPTSFERPAVNPSLTRPLLPSGLDAEPPVAYQRPAQGQFSVGDKVTHEGNAGTITEMHGRNVTITYDEPRLEHHANGQVTEVVGDGFHLDSPNGRKIRSIEVPGPRLPSPDVPPNIETMTSAEAEALGPEKLRALLQQREARLTIPTEGAPTATNKLHEMLRAANGGGQPSQAEVIDNLNRRLGIERRQPDVQLPPTAVEQRVGERRTSASSPAEGVPAPNLARPGPIEHGPVAAPVPNVSGATAEFTAFRQDGAPEYLVHGGPNDRSTLSADELQKQGIDVPPTPAAPAAGAPKTVPANVKAFLTRQLGYTPEQVDALGFDEAIRAGREKIPAPVPTATPAEAEQVLEQMRSLTSKSAPPIAEVPFALKAGEAAKAAPVEQPTLLTEAAAGVQTSAEAARRTIRGTGESPREMGTNPKAAEEFDKLIDAGKVDEAEQLLSKQIENRIKSTFKHGVGPKEPDGGTTLGSGFGALQPIFDRHPEVANRVLRSVLGAGVGAYLDKEHRGRGAIIGGLAGANALELVRAIGNAELLHTSSGVAPVRVPRAPGDINIFELIGPSTPERTIPEQFNRVRPAYVQFEKALRKEYEKTGTPIPTERVRAIRNNIVGPAIRQIRKDAVAMKTAGEIWKAKYANAFADYLSGNLTFGQRAVQTLSKGRLRPDVIERIVGKLTYHNLTGWAADTVLQNATQPAMALAHVPAKDMIEGLLELGTPEGRSLLNETLLKLERPTDLIESTLGPFGKTLKAIDSQVGMRAGDNFNQRWVYLSARRYAERQGLDTAAVDSFAQAVMRKTQGTPGPLGKNPFHRGPMGGSLSSFTKFPGIFTEHIVDILKAASVGQNLPGAARFAGAIGGAILLGNYIGTDMADLLVSGGRPLGIDISHPESSVERIASGDAFTTVRALKDIARHLTGTADHDLAAFDSVTNFLGSDLAPFVIGRYPTKVANFFLAKRTPENALITPGAGGKIRDVTTGREAILNLAGLRTTRQTQRREALTSYYEEAGKGLQDYNAQRRQAYDELAQGLDSGDVDAVRHAAATIGDPTAIRQFLVRRTQLPEERFNRTLPPALRRAMQGRLTAVQETAVKP
jgi:hypothetical protein